MLESTLFKVDKQQLDVYDLLDSIEPLINELDNFQDEWSDKRTILHNEIQNDRILNAGQLKTDFASNLIDMLNINNKKNELHDRISSIIASALSMLVEILIEVINDQDDTPVATRNSIRNYLVRIISLLQNPVLISLNTDSIVGVSARGEVIARLATAKNRNYYRIRDFFRSIRRISCRGL